METFKKFARATNQTGGLPQEQVRGVDEGLGIATLQGSNDDMVDGTADAEGKEVSHSTIGQIDEKGT